eukprot:750884-Hanusia_phi.AAC.1
MRFVNSLVKNDNYPLPLVTTSGTQNYRRKVVSRRSIGYTVLWISSEVPSIWLTESFWQLELDETVTALNTHDRLTQPSSQCTTMSKDIARFVNSCSECLQAKSYKRFKYLVTVISCLVKSQPQWICQ